MDQIQHYLQQPRLHQAGSTCVCVQVLA